MSYLIDTNVLLRFVQAGHPMQTAAESAINILRDDGDDLCLIPQNLIEFWAVATRPLVNNGLDLTITEVAQQVTKLKGVFLLYLDVPAIYSEWESLVNQYQVKGRPTHDARIVAAMKVHGIDHILTFNTDDFKRYAEIQAIDPRRVATP